MSGYNPYISLLAMDTDKKILEIINNKETFQKEVVDAAYKVAKQRGLELNPDLSVNFNYECIVDIINSDEKNSKRKKKKTNLRLSSFYSFIFGAMILATTLLPNWKNKIWGLFDYEEIPLFEYVIGSLLILVGIIGLFMSIFSNPIDTDNN